MLLPKILGYYQKFLSFITKILGWIHPKPSICILLLETYKFSPLSSGILQGFCTGLGPPAISRDPPDPSSGMLQLWLFRDDRALEHPAQSTKCSPEEEACCMGTAVGEDLGRICSNDFLFHATNTFSQKGVSLEVILSLISHMSLPSRMKICLSS